MSLMAEKNADNKTVAETTTKFGTSTSSKMPTRPASRLTHRDKIFPRRSSQPRRELRRKRRDRADQRLPSRIFFEHMPNQPGGPPHTCTQVNFLGAQRVRNRGGHLTCKQDFGLWLRWPSLTHYSHSLHRDFSTQQSSNL